MTEMLQANWNYPTAISVGAGRLAEVAAACAKLGINRPLLVTDPGGLALPFTQPLLERCGNNRLQTVTGQALIKSRWRRLLPYRLLPALAPKWAAPP